MMKFIQGPELTKGMADELVANLFSAVCVRINPETEEIEQAFEYLDDAEAGVCIKFDPDDISEANRMILETALFSRMQGGVLPANLYQLDDTILQNCFALTAGSKEKQEIIQNDILRGAKVSEEQIFVLTQPFAPNMFSSQVVVIIAVNLNDDQMKAIQLSTKVAQHGIKITNFTKKASMIATSSTNVLNRVSKEVVLAGVEVGATLGAGAVKTGVEATACVANIAIRDLNPKELAKGDNVQTLMKTVNGLFKKNKEQQTLTRGFGAL